jgi:hypothetical protein
MFRAMCKGTEGADEPGSESPQQSTRKGRKSTGEKIFSNNTQAFLVAAAVGIVRNKKQRPGEDTAQLIRGEYLRKEKQYNHFRQLIKSKFDAKTDHEIADFMVQFSEFGVRELYDEYHKTGDIDFARLSRLGNVGRTRAGKPLAVEDLMGLPVVDLVMMRETNALEFKSSLLWDYRQESSSKEMKLVVARAISCFMNSEGGILLIGVDDNRKILGLDRDLAQLHESLDEFERTLTNAINTHLGRINRSYMNVEFEKVENKDVAVISVKKSPHPVYVKCEGKKEEFHFRSGNSCQQLELSDATRYIKEHWSDLR